MLARSLVLALCMAPALRGEVMDPLKARDGTMPSSALEWREHVLPGTLQLFREQVYGKRPIAKPDDFTAKVIREDSDALDGTAIVKEIEITYSGPGGKGRIRPLLVLPKLNRPAAAFLLIHFRKPSLGGATHTDWPVKKIVSRGYAAVAFDFNEVEPDQAEGFRTGVRGIFGKQPIPNDAWGALSAWGWGASRVMDYLETDSAIDSKRVAIVGHSRAGKASLWAAAEDRRFAMAISNNSGCGGAALTQGKRGEQISNITRNFPWWFCTNYQKYSAAPETLPVDQHQLIASIAPRPVYVASATHDLWADPAAEFRSCVLATPVFEFHGVKGISKKTMPEPDHALTDGKIGYHLRSGKHELTLSDWTHFMDFSDKHLRP